MMRLRRRLNLLVAEGPEYAPDGVEDIIAFGHFALAEVAGPLGDGWFLCHGLTNKTTNIRFFRQIAA